MLRFFDASRAPAAVQIESLEVYLSQAPCLDLHVLAVSDGDRVWFQVEEASNDPAPVDLRRSSPPEILHSQPLTVTSDLI